MTLKVSANSEGETPTILAESGVCAIACEKIEVAGVTIVQNTLEEAPTQTTAIRLGTDAGPSVLLGEQRAKFKSLTATVSVDSGNYQLWYGGSNPTQLLNTNEKAGTEGAAGPYEVKAGLNMFWTKPGDHEPSSAEVTAQQIVDALDYVKECFDAEKYPSGVTLYTNEACDSKLEDPCDTNSLQTSSPAPIRRSTRRLMARRITRRFTSRFPPARRLPRWTTASSSRPRPRSPSTESRAWSTTTSTWRVCSRMACYLSVRRSCSSVTSRRRVRWSSRLGTPTLRASGEGEPSFPTAEGAMHVGEGTAWPCGGVTSEVRTSSTGAEPSRTTSSSPSAERLASSLSSLIPVASPSSRDARVRSETPEARASCARVRPCRSLARRTLIPAWRGMVMTASVMVPQSCNLLPMSIHAIFCRFQIMQNIAYPSSL